MEQVTSRRRFDSSARLDAPPVEVFPLLCPVREYDWIEDWRCELVYTASGIAEEGCIFRTASPMGSGDMTWVVARYEPPRRIEFACVASGLVMRLRVVLEPAEAGTELRWSREYTAASPAGETWLTGLDAAAVAAATERLFERLAHYLRHGARLQ